MTTYRLKRFTQWDETDRLKAMKDSDILAEKKRNSTGNTVNNMVTGAVTGTVGGALLGGAGGLITGNKLKGKIGAAGRLGKTAAIGGAVLGAGMGYLKNRKEAKENRFYNQRLEYAQRQAIRREKKDWKTNMTQREGYSY